ASVSDPRFAPSRSLSLGKEGTGDAPRPGHSDESQDRTSGRREDSSGRRMGARFARRKRGVLPSVGGSEDGRRRARVSGSIFPESRRVAALGRRGGEPSARRTAGIVDEND